jgi:hypothetical protein
LAALGIDGFPMPDRHLARFLQTFVGTGSNGLPGDRK